jgi:hypothetical protein
MKRLLTLVLLATVSCATIGPPTTGNDVRVTTNPDVVRGCTFLGNVETGAWASFGNNNRPGWANEKWLRQDTERLGGNVVYINSNDRSGASGEAYLCQ